MLKTSSNKIEKEFENLRKELLDLTLRNQLLNFKARAKTITVVNQSTINVYQTLVLQNKKMYFVANKKEENEEKSRFSIWDHSPIDFSRFTGPDNTLQTNLTPNELQKRLFYINNQAKTMLQEKGYNILYLAVGFLEWNDNTKPKQKNLAPLVLIPVVMERKKVGKSFELSWTGEDLQTNISLKAKLRENGIELPEFHPKKYGEVIDHYLREVKQAVSPIRNWKVNDNVALGFFSFTKFVMYNDLNPKSWADNVDLTKNELIQAIFNPSKNDKDSFKEEDIDSTLEYENMYQVLDADSSQIAAIQDVKAGRNLVVEGPPGTGKSQTIVNLIAELLAEGKSVLFVSEKMAALDVVRDRLTKVGLGKFVLELHSHKTRRKKLLNDLKKATSVRAEEPFKVDQIIRKLETLRKQLDDYAEIIHKPLYAVNLSAFQLYGMKESADDHFSKKDTIIPLVRFDHPEALTLKDLDDITLSLENLAELYQTISNENPWSKCSPKSLLPADLREIEILINDTLNSLNNFIMERDMVYETFGIKKPDSLNDFTNSLQAFKLIESKNASLIDAHILKSHAWESDANGANILIGNLEKYQSVAKIFDKFNNTIFSADIRKLIHEVQSLANKKFRLFKSKQNEELVEMYYKGSVPGTNEILNDLRAVEGALHLKKQMDDNEKIAYDYFGNYWHLKADINDLKAISKWMREFLVLKESGMFSEDTVNLLSNDLFNVNPEENLSEYIRLGNIFKNDLDSLQNKLNPRSKLIFKRDFGDVTFNQWRTQLNNWRGQLSSLHLWSQYLNTKERAKGTYAEPFIEAIEKRNIKKDDVYSLVIGNFADSLLNILFLENQELATFIGELHDNRIREFKDLDQRILALNRKRIFHKLNSNIPQIFGATENPEAKVLAGEFTRKSGHLPVRKLLEKAGGIIKQIKPVFMMSPLSIAQYLDPTNEKLQFDVVIFDEASQVKPEDALGAFMRGKTAVVMGDTQQLPPTSFFDQMSSAEGEEEVATSMDMESILHLCKLSFPVKMLKWHYRSRHESLISVSNNLFYDDELLVYPSPSRNDPELGLKLHYNPNTVYDRGSSSANRAEARDVVKEIFKHFDKYGDTKSLGVGTFSVAQKNAILEELELERKNRPELEPLFAENKDERFFVKNLETIQGDERDVIFISVGYGYDENGKMSLNFGPLNQDGGERRLNVLITRAREKCVVFSNFKAYDMNLTANPPFGVKALKEFLGYAETLTLGHKIVEEYREEPFEDAIYSFLVENGYEVDKQVGCAGFRVDLAIVDDENPGKYILGINTDGKMYASSKVARDRDRLREQVLTGLGWNLYHLWSTDWYRNRDLGRKKLLEAVENAKKEAVKLEQKKTEEAEKLALKLKQQAEKAKLEREKEAEEARKAELEAKARDAEEVNDLKDLDDTSDNLEDIERDLDDASDNLNDEIASGEDEEYIIPQEEVTPRKISDDENIEVVSEVDELEEVTNVADIKEEFLNEVKKEENVYTVNFKDKKNDSNNDIEINNSKKDNEKESSDEEKKEMNNDNASLKKPKIKDKIINNNNNKSLDNEVNRPRKKQSMKERIVNSIISGITEGESYLNPQNNVKEDLEEKIKDNSNNEKSAIYEIDNDYQVESNDDNQKMEVEEIEIDEKADSPFEDYIIEDDKSPFDNIKFKSNINWDDEEIHEKATTVVNDSFDKLLDDLTEEDIGDMPKFEENNLNDESDFNEYYYQGINDVNSPLKKNNLYHDKKSALGKISAFKDEIKYINKSLKEIENPTEIGYVSVIDRTKDPVEYPQANDNPQETSYSAEFAAQNIDETNLQNDDYITPMVDKEDYHEYEEEKIIDIDDSEFAEMEEKRIREEQLMEALKKELSNDDNSILTIHEEERRKAKEDMELEDIIHEVDEEYKEIEHERHKQNYKLKDFDDKKLPGKGKTVKDFIHDYKKADDIGIKSSDELYDKSPEEISASINKIVDVEGPIHVNEVINRVKENCDIKRAGSKFKSAVNDAIKVSEDEGSLIIIDDFLFNLNNDVEIRKRVKPNIDLISNEEITKNIETVLEFKEPIELNKLTKDVSRNFGFKSTSKKTAAKINKVLDSLIAEGKVELNKDIVELK